MVIYGTPIFTWAKMKTLRKKRSFGTVTWGKSGAVVPRLMNGLFGVGYKLYLDNWYTSQILISYLEENGTAACGTARANRIDLPDSFKKAALPKGKFRFRRSDNQLAIRYHNKKEVYFLSTIHTAKTTTIQKRNGLGPVQKPILIDDYNHHMGGVDKNDALVGNYSCVRKSYKWTTKIFMHYLEEAVFNSFMIHKKLGGKLQFLDF